MGSITGFNDYGELSCCVSASALIIAQSDTNKENCTYVNNFSSGEACYILNGNVNAGTNWYQNLDNGETADEYPVLDSTHGLVYKIGSYYSNFEKPRWCGDLDEDGDLDDTDISLLVDIITGKSPLPEYVSIADFNYDKQVTVADLVYLIDVVNGNRDNVPINLSNSNN